MAVRPRPVLPDRRAAHVAVARAEGAGSLHEGPAREARRAARGLHGAGEPGARVGLVQTERWRHRGPVAVRSRAGVAPGAGADLVSRGAARILARLRGAARPARERAPTGVAAAAGERCRARR